MNRIVYSIGHSTHPIEHFTELLTRHAITTVCDVRSNPYSRFNPQFNREKLAQALAASQIDYVFLGKELGARSEDDACYEGRKVQYDRLVRTSLFKKGLDRMEEVAEGGRAVLMCAEKEPLDCHRTILVAPQVEGRGLVVEHILHDGSLELHAATMNRLLRLLGLPDFDLLRSHQEILEDAYKIRGAQVAYERPIPPRAPDSRARKSLPPRP